MTKKFTRDELEQALVQIQQEAAEVADLARRAAEWLAPHVLPLSVHVQAPEQRWGLRLPGVREDGLPEHWLSISHCEYDNGFNEWLTARLQPTPTPSKEQCFILELGAAEGFPEGTRYYCQTLYYNPHASGF